MTAPVTGPPSSSFLSRSAIPRLALPEFDRTRISPTPPTQSTRQRAPSSTELKLAQPKLTIATRVEGGSAVIVVDDNGPGIPRRQLERIWRLNGIAHRPLAEVSLDEAVREIGVSKLKLEEQLARPVRAYAYVKGSEAHFHPVHESILKQAGYDIAFTSISRSNGVETDPFRLGRYNVEPYPARTFELVLAGACDLISLKDTVAGTHARRLFNQALGTSTSREGR